MRRSPKRVDAVAVAKFLNKSVGDVTNKMSEIENSKPFTQEEVDIIVNTARIFTLADQQIRWGVIREKLGCKKSIGAIRSRYYREMEKLRKNIGSDKPSRSDSGSSRPVSGSSRPESSTECSDSSEYYSAVISENEEERPTSPEIEQQMKIPQQKIVPP